MLGRAAFRGVTLSLAAGISANQFARLPDHRAGLFSQPEQLAGLIAGAYRLSLSRHLLIIARDTFKQLAVFRIAILGCNDPQPLRAQPIARSIFLCRLRSPSDRWHDIPLPPLR